jgi:hypothetical protein
MRDPALRVEHELARRCREWHRCDRRAEIATLANAAKELMRMTRPVGSERLLADRGALLYALPQSWYVYDSKGALQCDCVLSYDNIARLAHHHPSRPPFLRRASVVWPASLASLYVPDARLWRNVSNALRVSRPSACYRPARAQWQRATAASLA